MKKPTHILVAGYLMVLCSVSLGVTELHDFTSDQQRIRYQNLIDELRCPKCQNQNLADSNSQISIDLRNEVFRMMQEGKSNDQIKDYLVMRYGDFVLYRPPVQGNTLVLWWSPIIMLLIGSLVFAAIVIRRQRYSSSAGVDDAGEEGDSTSDASLSKK